MSVTFGCVLSQAIYGPTASPERLRTLAQLAEKLGFDSVWFPDHIIIPRTVHSHYPYAADGASPFAPDEPFYEPLSVLNFLAGCTQRVRLGTHVLIIPYRDPILTAKILATIDVLSGGRLTLGAGVGWMEEEFTGLGLATYRQRGAVTNEYLQIFKELWKNTAPNFDGKFCKVADVGFEPKPVQKPHPPIWIGGHSTAALRRAARLGDGWMPIGLRPATLLLPAELEGKVAELRQYIREAGRPVEDVTISFTAPVIISATGSNNRSPLQGRPDEIAEDFRRFRSIGVSNFNVNVPAEASAQSEFIEQFAKEVMPLAK